MKRKIFLAITVIVALTIVCTLEVLGISTIRSISAYVNDNLNLTLNGQKFIPLDEDGSTLTPIIYKDRTYLPVRAIANALNTKINWNDDTKTVIIGEGNINPIDKYFNENINTAFSNYEIGYITNNYYEGWKNEFENLAKLVKESYTYDCDKQLIDDYSKNLENLALNKSEIIYLYSTDPAVPQEERLYGTAAGTVSTYEMALIYKNGFDTLINTSPLSTEDVTSSYNYIFKTPKPISEL